MTSRSQRKPIPVVAIATVVLVACSGDEPVPVTDVSDATQASVEPAVESTASQPAETAVESTESQRAETAVEPPEPPSTNEQPATEPAASTTLTTPAPTTTEAEAAEPDPVSFLTEVFSADTNRIEAAIEQTVPTSPAEIYTRVQVSLNAITEQEGQPVSQYSISRSGDAVEVCAASSDCSLYTNFVADRDLFVSFDVDDTPIAPRLGGSSAPVVIGPLTIQVVHSYRSVSSDTLFVVLEMSTTESVSVSIFSASYIGPDGRQLASADALGPFELFRGASAGALVLFPQADPGGRLILDAFNDDDFEIYEFDLDVPILQPGG